MAYVLTLLLWPQIEVPEIEAEISARIELRHFNTLDVAVFSQLEAEICIGDIGAVIPLNDESIAFEVSQQAGQFRAAVGDKSQGFSIHSDSDITVPIVDISHGVGIK